MTSSWWAKKLGNDQPAPSRSPVPPSSPAPVPRVAPAPRPVQQQVQNIHVTDQNFAEAATQWRGGEAARTENRNCPNCSSDLYFSRSNTGSQVAGRCYACGYTDGRPMQGVPS